MHTQVIQALSETTTNQITNINKSFSAYSFYEKVLTIFPLLQKIDISDSSLTFSSVLMVVQALRNHPNLQILNLSGNISSYYLECEFLIDVILSVNQLLTNVNVCGRNIRPRFNDDCMFVPLNCNENSTRFVLQNLYFTQHIFVNKFDQPASGVFADFIKANEECPISDENIISYYVDHNGGTFYNQDHDFALVIPPGAVSQGDCVEIQATASRFGPYKLPDDYYPVSGYFWLSACYTFNIPVYLIMSHYAIIRNVEDIANLCMLQACVRDLTISEGKRVMKEVLKGVYFDFEIGYCIFTTDHFCSFCLAKKIKHIPERFSAVLYTYDTSDTEHVTEVCICPAICDCRKVHMYYCTYVYKL